MNARFEYLYRDAGNYKNWGEIVFSNPHNLDTDFISTMAEKVLIDGAYFVASKAGVPDLHVEIYDENLDHGWHEFYSFQLTDEAPTDSQKRDIETFIRSLQHASQI
jgi:hypothetical protein